MEKLKEYGQESTSFASRLCDDLEDEDPMQSGLLDPLPTYNNEEPKRVEKNEQRTAFLDGLRGFAAFLVYMSHHVPWWYGMDGYLGHGFGYHGERYFAQLPFIRSLFSGGAAAVAIFFVLSGYVLSVSPLRMLRQRKRKTAYRSLASAFIRRPLRLFIPPIGVSLTFAMIMHLPFGLAPHLQWPVAEASIFAELKAWIVEVCWMMNPLEAHGIFTKWFRYDPPVWTMAIEFAGSMLVYSSIALFSPAPPRIRTYLFAATGLLLFATYRWEMALFMGGIVLSINDLDGFDIAFLSKRLTDRGRAILYNAIFFAAWWILCEPAGVRDPERSYNTPGWYYLSMVVPKNYLDNEYYRFWNTIGAIMLVYSVLRLEWLQAVFSRPWLRYLGKISFSLYLTHIPLEWTVGDRIYRLLGVVRQEFTTPYDGLLTVPDIGPRGFSLGFIVAQMVILPLNILLADLGTKVLDDPSVKAGKWVAGKLGLNKSNSQNR